MTRPAEGAPWPTGGTRLVALLRWPAHRSLSPVIHNAALREQGIDLVYLSLPTHPDDLHGVVAALGAVGAVGANVTVPHKEAVIAACDQLTEEAEFIGAVNTLVWQGGGLLGDNTDAAGWHDALTAEVSIVARDGYVVLGTGGAARAVAVAVGRLQGRLTVAGRRPDAAADLASLAVRAGAASGVGVEVRDQAALRSAIRDARVVVNATPLGLYGERLPAAFEELDPGQVAYDLLYDPPETPFLRAARERGAEAHHGLGMLVAQAAASYRHWTGRKAPLGTMSAAAIGALSDPSRRT